MTVYFEDELELYLERKRSLYAFILNLGLRKASTRIRQHLQYCEDAIKLRDEKIARLSKEIKELKPPFEIKFEPCTGFSGEQGSYVVIQHIKDNQSTHLKRCATKEDAEQFIKLCKQEWKV